MRRHIRTWVPILLFASVVGHVLPLAPEAYAQTGAPIAELRIGGEVTTPLVLTLADQKKCPGRPSPS